jgi:hypothetical protein
MELPVSWASNRSNLYALGRRLAHIANSRVRQALRGVESYRQLDSTQQRGSKVRGVGAVTFEAAVHEPMQP